MFTIQVTEEIIKKAVRGTLECPVYLALIAAGYDVGFVNIGILHDKLIGNVYHTHKQEALIQPLPEAVTNIIRNYDKTGDMQPFAFDLPDLE